MKQQENENNAKRKVSVRGRYLNPKADLTFKLIFGEHKDLVMSLLNALLPLEKGEEIESVEYATPEMIPENPAKKNSIVDVRCKDVSGREFIVEMQMYWNDDFKKRVLLNASKAVVKQAGTSDNYSLIQPVYSLNLVNEGLRLDSPTEPDEYYHDYAIVNVEHSDRIIEGLRFVFIDLEKFTPKTITEKKMGVLWLRFLTEINEETQEVPEELLENPQTRKALEILEKSAFTDGQLLAYSDFWMSLVDERVLREGARKNGYAEGRAEGYADGIAEGMEKGMEKGIAQGMEKGIAQGMEKGIAQGMEKGIAQGMEKGMEKTKSDIARNLKEMGMTTDAIAQATGLSAAEIDVL